MGAWGAGNFENDDALDWVYELEESSDLSLLNQSFKAVLENEGAYLEAYECARALAAAEVVAALQGKRAADLAPEVENWLQKHDSQLQADQQTTEHARGTVQLIVAASELKELWEETEAYEEWLAVVEDLQRRLT